MPPAGEVQAAGAAPRRSGRIPPREPARSALARVLQRHVATETEMSSNLARPPSYLHSVQSIEIDAPVTTVFSRWTRYEELPLLTRSVRRIKCIDASQILWDAEVGGRQVVWEARVVEEVPQKLVRWESRWGASHRGEVRFEALGDGRTRLEVEIVFRPRGLIERLGARLGLMDLHLRRDLECFRYALEREAREPSPAEGSA